MHAHNTHTIGHYKAFLLISHIYTQSLKCPVISLGLVTNNFRLATGMCLCVLYFSQTAVSIFTKSQIEKQAHVIFYVVT